MARPNNMYELLLKDVMTGFEPGTWVSVRTYVSPASAFTSVRNLKAGARPIPGKRDEWEFEAHKEMVVSEEGDQVKGSVLYARWLPKTRHVATVSTVQDQRPVHGPPSPEPEPEEDVG